MHGRWAAGVRRLTGEEENAGDRLRELGAHSSTSGRDVRVTHPCERVGGPVDEPRLAQARLELDAEEGLQVAQCRQRCRFTERAKPFNGRTAEVRRDHRCFVVSKTAGSPPKLRVAPADEHGEVVRPAGLVEEEDDLAGVTRTQSGDSLLFRFGQWRIELDVALL